MTKTENSKHYDLEDRTLEFARRVREFIRMVPKNLISNEDSRQVVRSSGSVGANYIEANEALSKKDFLMRIKICRKEAKESRYWLRLLNQPDVKPKALRKHLENESQELTNIFGAILRKSQ